MYSTMSQCVTNCTVCGQAGHTRIHSLVMCSSCSGNSCKCDCEQPPAIKQKTKKGRRVAEKEQLQVATATGSPKAERELQIHLLAAAAEKPATWQSLQKSEGQVWWAQRKFPREGRTASWGSTGHWQDGRLGLAKWTAYQCLERAVNSKTWPQSSSYEPYTTLQSHQL